MLQPRPNEASSEPAGGGTVDGTVDGPVLRGARWLSLIGVAITLALPVLTPPSLYYVDNAVHIAELQELARVGLRGWAELDFAGAPLGTLHSPLWYGLGAALVRLGVDAKALYAGLLLLGSLAPAAALLHIAERLRSPWSGWLAGLLWLALPSHTSGYASALGGMWTFHLALGWLVLLVAAAIDRHRAAEDAPDDRAAPLPGHAARRRMALLLGTIALTHLFVLEAAAVICLVATVSLAWRRRSVSLLGRDALAWALTAAATAAYWGPTLSHWDAPDLGRQDLGVVALLIRLLLPTDIITLVLGPPNPFAAVRLDLELVDALPTWALLGGGALSVVVHLRRAEPQRPSDNAAASLAKAGAVLAGATLAALLLAPLTARPWLGPVSWRFLDLVWLGAAMALAGLPLSPYPAGREQGGRAPAAARGLAVAALLAMVMIPAHVWWAAPLRRVVASDESSTWADLRASWQWLASRPGGDDDGRRGRVYVQDPFTGQGDAWLTRSHATVLQHLATGRRQVGSYYGVHPYRTGALTASEFGALLGGFDNDPREMARTLRLLAVDTVILSDRRWFAAMSRVTGFTRAWQRNQVSVWRRTDTPISWVPFAAPGVTITSAQYRGSTLRFRATSAPRAAQGSVTPTPDLGATAQTAVAFAPGWRVASPPGARAAVGVGGLLRVTHLPPGTSDVVLRWRPAWWPWLLSLVGGVFWLIWAWRGGLLEHGPARHTTRHEHARDADIIGP